LGFDVSTQIAIFFEHDMVDCGEVTNISEEPAACLFKMRYWYTVPLKYIASHPTET